MSKLAPPSAAAATDIAIPVADQGGLRLRIQGPRGGSGRPLVLHFHGGTFVDGDLDSGACMADLLLQAGATVVSVAYPLAPEHRFPVAVEAGYAALQWSWGQRAKLAGRLARLFVAGDEAGGNLAAAVALVARDRAGPPLAGQVLVAPMLDPCSGTASLREKLQCELHCKWAEGWQQYLRGPMDAEHPYAVPAHASRLAGLPPTLILSAQDDPLRDEAQAYGARLRAAGVPVTQEVLSTGSGWPETLAGPPVACPCAAAVGAHLQAFFLQPPPTPPG